jgi:hypothetical protein
MSDYNNTPPPPKGEFYDGEHVWQTWEDGEMW